MSVNLKDNLMTPDLQRTYEISLWTLQDGFIAVLGDSSSQKKGYIENPTMQLSNDGTQELNFSLPMYIDDGITRKKSSIWSQMTDAVTIAGMRKIKVIFNKGTSVQKVYEFVITTVTDTHEENKPMCDIHCEGLAFHELGKIGYKISLSLDDFYADQEAAWDAIASSQTSSDPDSVVAQITDEDIPQPTIDYWNEKIGLVKYPSSPSDVLSSVWYYRVQMDWTTFEQGTSRDTSKIYEESYISEYTTDLEAKKYTKFSEKTRFVESSGSNIYNLTQEIAKTFGVYCKYEYEYDENYHIIARIVTYYNNFIEEQERLEFTYPYTSKRVTRENDCTDLVTKMYVNTVENDQSDAGLITIMDNPVNPTGEDYLLNFDYLYSIGTISDEQYAYITTFSKQVKALNNQILKQQEIVIKKETIENVYNAQLEVLANAMEEDNERIAEAEQGLNDLTDDDKNNAIERSGNTRVELFTVNGTITFTDEGILPKTVKLYDPDTKAQITKTSSFTFTKNTNGYLVSISGLNAYASVLCGYSYVPGTYYSDIIDLYNIKYNNDAEKYNKLVDKITRLQNELDQATEKIEKTIADKQELIKTFERTMGPALREGNWTPDEYNNVANAKYQLMSTITMSKTNGEWNASNNSPLDVKIINANTTGPKTQLIWDAVLNYDDIDNKYSTYEGEEKYYYVLLLTSSGLSNIIDFYSDARNEGIPYGLIWWNANFENSSASSPLIKMLSIGSGCELAFLCYNNTSTPATKIIKPALILTELIDDDGTILADLNDGNTLYLGSTTVTENSGAFSLQLTNNCVVDNQIGSFLIDQNTLAKYSVNQLRIRINDNTLLTDEQNLKLMYGTTSLKEFDDYTITQIINPGNEIVDKGYDITIKPSSLLKMWNTSKKLSIHYACSQLSTAIYLDAVQVLKENAYPKVTYSVDPNIMYKDFFYTDYNALNKIAFINDTELAFEQVQGYISSISLNLDKPWEDTIEVKNYKNKFEDIFSTIVAQTESMEHNEALMNSMSNAVNLDGSLSTANLQSALQKSTIKYTLSNGFLSIGKGDSILCNNAAGAIALRPVGLYFSSSTNENGNWNWQAAITNQGIDASAITLGTLALNNFNLKGINTEFNTSDGLISKDQDANLTYDNGHIIINKGKIISNRFNVHFTNSSSPIVTQGAILTITQGRLTSNTLYIDNGELISNTLYIDNGELISKNITTTNDNGTTTETINYTLSILDGKLTSNVLTIENGILTLVDNRNTDYNAVQLVPSTNNSDAYLYINNKNNLIIGDKNIQSYIESIADGYITGSWSGHDNYIPISNINIGRSSNNRTVYLTTSQLRLGAPQAGILFKYLYDSENKVATLALGGVTNPVLFTTMTYNSALTTTNDFSFILAGWNADAGTLGLYTKDVNNNIIAQIHPSKLKINNYIETIDNDTGKNVILSKLWLTRATLGSNQDHVITFLNNDLENTPDYKLMITSEGLFYSLDGGITYVKVATVTTPTS